MAPEKVNLLEYVRSKSEVDCDCLDLIFARELGPFVDCTSNQADAFYELQNSAREELLNESIKLAREWQNDYPELSFEQLALDIAMVKLSLTMAPFLSGAIHVMANPLNQTSIAKLVANGIRIEELLRRIDASFDLSRLVIKVVSTWEGLQACRQLESKGIKTIATTLFTFEQAVLASEVGCYYIAPFLHELKAFFDETYKDNDPCFDLCVKIQQYYEQLSSPTKVKVAGLLTSDQAVRLAGAQTMTIAPAVLKDLSQAEETMASVASKSLYKEDIRKRQKQDVVSYLNEEAKWREAFEKSNHGKGVWKTAQAIEIFSEYQINAEKLIRDHTGA